MTESSSRPKGALRQSVPALAALAGPEAAAALEVAHQVERTGAQIVEWFSNDRIERTETKTVGKGAHARVVTTHYTLHPRGDVAGLVGLVLVAEAIGMFSHALAGLDPANWGKDIAGVVAGEVTWFENAWGIKIPKVAPASGQPTSVAAALSYHGLRANAHYTALRARMSQSQGGTG